MPELMTSVGRRNRFPQLRLGCPGDSKSSGPGNSGRGQIGTGIARTPLNSTRMRISSGDRGIAQTIRYMQGVAVGNEGAASAEIRRQALTIVQPIASRDQQGEIAAILQWVKNNIAFRGEYQETVQTPLVTLQLRAGDCDDQSSLLAALLMSLGYKVRFNTVAADPSAPWAFSHVFTEVFQRKSGQWISLDATVPASYPGWRPPRVFRSQSWRALGDATPPGTGANTQAVVTLLTPISQAVGQRIAYGRRSATANFNVGLNSNSGGISPMWLLVGGGALFLGVAYAMGGRKQS